MSKQRIKKGEKTYMQLPVTVKGVNVETASLEAIFSDEKEDRHGDTVVQDGWDLKSFKKNPVILNSHNYNDAAEVIGKASNLKIENKKLTGKIIFAVNENPKAKIIFDLYAGGFLNAFSVGFIPKDFKEDDYFTITSAELFEVSAVSVPSNARALAKSKGIDLGALEDEDYEDENTEKPEESDDDEIPEDTSVSGTEGGFAPEDSDGDEEGQKQSESDDSDGDTGDPEDGGTEADKESTTEKRARLREEQARIESELKELQEDEEDDDPIIEAPGNATYEEKVLKALHSIETRETRKLKRVKQIVESMLTQDNDGTRMEKDIQEKVRKRKINQAIRALSGIK